MNTIHWKKLLPGGVAVILFYLLSLTYFSPVLEGKQLMQGDKRNWQGMAQEVQEHRAEFNEEPLWTGSMFSGMPAYQISVKWSSNLLRFADDLFHGFLPRPAGFLFLYLLGMFILLRCLRVDPWLSVVGAVAYAFSSYFFVILEAGHNSKANAIGYMPAVLGGFYLLYRGRMLLGGALFALFLGMEILVNHVQVTYYLAILMGLFALAEAVRNVREGALPDFLRRTGVAAVAVVLAVACNVGLLWSTWEYGKYTTRGASELTIAPDGSSAADIRTSGLDRDYVVQWSYGKQESFSLLVPNVKGGASASMITTQEDLAAISDPGFRNALVKEYQGGGYVNAYWGDQSFTSGPVYLGALVVLLLLLALAQAEGRELWWMLGSVPLLAVMLSLNSAPIAGVLMLGYILAGIFLSRDTLRYALFSALLLTLGLSWGSNYMPLTDFFLDHVPGYNKFRAVTIILVIVELTAPVLAILYLDRLLREGAWDTVKQRRFMIPAGILVALLLVMTVMPGSMFDFISDAERTAFNARIDSGEASEAEVVAFVDNIKEHRQEVLSADAFRSLVFVLLGGALIFLFGKGKVGRTVVIVGLGVLMLADQWTVDKRYVNNEKEKGRYTQWEDAVSAVQPFAPNKADMAILQQEFSPSMEPGFEAALQRLKESKEGARASARRVTPTEETIARFGVLRRNSHFRVLNLNNPFNDSRVSYFHKSIGGYHGAKLKRYQELIEFHLAPELNAVIRQLQGTSDMQAVNDILADQHVLNMLNTRYLVYSPDQAPIRNLNALGTAWFVENIQWAKNSDEEIMALRTIDPAVSAVVDERYRTQLGDAALASDPTATVELTEYRANRMTYSVQSAAGGVVVFSEIWYGPDWQAYIDGAPVEHVRADYVLRALRVPAGSRTVEFRLESAPYDIGSKASMAASAILLLLVIAVLGSEWKRRRTEGA